MSETVLITGGAGFIGRHLTVLLLREEFRVVVLDILESQVHASGPPVLPLGAELIMGDIRDRSSVERALDRAGHVVHLAAQVGVGQSMYEIERYTAANVVGTAVLLESVAARRGQVRSLVVASSMSVYGEGAYRCLACGPRHVSGRRREHLATKIWEPCCDRCGAELEPAPTPETHPLRPASVYAITKRDQEELCLAFGRAYGVPVVALRFFNVYGPGQSLQNPYTGVAALFAARLLAGEPPLVFEDGMQTRDFVHVEDVARACYLALKPEVGALTLNVGTGEPRSILDVAAALQDMLGGRDPSILNAYRPGDIRHCFADISAIRQTLGWEPQVSFSNGLASLAEWLTGQAGDGLGQLKALEELRSKGLVQS